jgi:glyoxylase-like metal-dependent hydrolase (beta-lactamase superfamily II)/rhodanese-related sulfurtransferase
VEFKQFYLGCLAHASYLIGSEGEAAVIDPRRDVDEYIDEAKARGLAIRCVIETHLHADFVSGHLELSERTGAKIVFSHRAGVTFPHLAVREGDQIRLGSVELRVLETPGHTPESICLVATDHVASETPRLVFTGDTLFIGDVGRPDLAGARGFTPAEMAGMLYDSLHQKLLTLPDSVEVYPAHGAGSLCGRNISKETSSTIGEQRRLNYALQPMGKDAFVRIMTADLPEVPAYFPADVARNREGAPALDERPPVRALRPDAFARAAANAVVLDVRGAAAFSTGHVPGSLSLGLSGQFASWAGSLVDGERDVVLVTDDAAAAEEAAMRLSRVGLDRVAGYLDGGIAAWQADGRTVATLPQISVDELRAQAAENASLQVIDVRRAPEFADGHVPGARHHPLDRLPHELAGLERARPTAVVCAGGYRSSAAASILQAAGFTDLRDVVGGTTAWTAAGFPLERPAA